MIFRIPLHLSVVLRRGLALAWLLIAAACAAYLLGEAGMPRGGSWVGALALVLLSAGLGWALRQAWIFPLRFQKAEELWRTGASPRHVLEALQGCTLALGELGFRVHLLRSLVLWELEDRPSAWQASLQAALSRLPFWQRWPIGLYLLLMESFPAAWQAPLGEFLGARLAEGSRFHHFLAVRHLRSKEEPRIDRAWQLMTLTLQGCQEDPLVLEDLLLSSLHRLLRPEALAPGLKPTLVRIFEGSFHLLRTRHGHTRCSWDRLAPMPYLFAQGRCDEVLNLARSLPEERRPPGLWEAESLALRELGNLTGAEQAARQGLLHHPGAFRLWMELHTHAVHRRDHGQALLSLERAQPLIEDQEDAAEAQWEWMLRRAEFAYWVEGDPAQAWSLLTGVPESRQEHNPPLRLQLLVALGRHTEAQPAIEARLKEHPRDLDLQLLLADCLAGMDAWEALLPFLESFRETGAARSDFWHLLGLAQAHLRHRIPARECLERAALMDPDQLRMTLDAGHGCMELAEWERAEYHWRRALHLDPHCEEALLQLSESRRALHDPNGARQILRECLLAHPESVEAQGFLAELEAN